MARAKLKKISAAQRLTGYGVLAVLGLITVWLLVQQSRFNPAVIAALQAPGLSGKIQGGAPAATAGLIVEADGFVPQTPVQSYGPDNLSDKIDGKAELYLSAGFKEMSCRSFTLENPKGAHLEVFIYDMGTPQNAFAVFSSQRRSGSEPISLTANAYTTANALFFTRGKYYVEMVADRAIEALPKVLEGYIKPLLAKLPAEEETKNVAALLPPEGLTQDSVRLNAADAFGLQGFDNVYTGEYSLKNGKATAFFAERQSPEAARAEAERYLEFLTANGYKKIQPPGAVALGTLLALEDSFELVMVQGRAVAGVHDATSAAAAEELATRLQQALKKNP
jgi:Family of unknown function (DUF6599)